MAREAIKQFLYALALAFFIWSPASAEESPRNMGLFPPDQKLHNKLLQLIGIKYRGFQYEKTGFISPWMKSPDFFPFLLHAENGYRPRLQVRNYLNRWQMFPTIEELLPLNAATDDSTNRIAIRAERDLSKQLALTERSPQFQELRSWQKTGLLGTLRLEHDFNEFLKTTQIQFRMVDVPLEGLPVELHPLILEEAQKTLSRDAPYRFALENGRLVGYYVDPQPLSFGGPLFLGHTESEREVPLPLMPSQIRSLVIAASSYIRPIDQHVYARLKNNSSRVLAERPDLAAELRAVADKIRSLGPDQERIANLLRKAPLKARFLLRINPPPDEYRLGLKLARWTKVRSGVEKIFRQKLHTVVGKLAFMAIVLTVASDAADIYKATGDITNDHVAQAIGNLIFDLGLAKGLYALGFSPWGIAVIATGIALEAGHYFIPACPGISDVRDFCAGIFADMGLLAGRTWNECVVGDNIAMDEWQEIRRRYFPTVHGQESSHSEASEDDDASFMTTPPDALTVDQKMQFQALSRLSQTEETDVLKEAKSEPEKVYPLDLASFEKETLELLHDKSKTDIEQANAIEHIAQLYAQAYLRLSFATLQFLGQKKPCESMALTFPGLYLLDDYSLSNEKKEVFQKFSKELSQFISKLESFRKPLAKVLKEDPQQQLLEQIAALRLELEGCGVVDENVKFFNPETKQLYQSKTPCKPSAAQLELARLLRSIEQRLAP